MQALPGRLVAERALDGGLVEGAWVQPEPFVVERHTPPSSPRKTSPDWAGLQAMACTSPWMPNCADQFEPPLVDSSSDTPAANTWFAFTGSTHSRPNHQP